MIAVKAQPEPASFDAQVRQPGAKWLAKKGLAGAMPIPKGVKAPPYWSRCQTDLHRAYSGICAYLCIWIEPMAGGVSVDHYVAKSKRADLTYDWGNYRLACSRMNSIKRDYDDVLDPFALGRRTFELDLQDGSIAPAKLLSWVRRDLAQATIDRLDLDRQECRQLRLRWWDEYLNDHIDADYLRRHSPFVWGEARRQGLL